MAYNVENLTKLGALKQLAEKIKSDYATKADLTAEISTKVSSTYKAGGSAAFDSLPELTEANLGLVVNVSDAFTTTESFVDGAGGNFPAGTNVAVVQSGEDFKYDVLSGFIDMSGFVAKEDGKGLSANDFTDEEKEKLNGIETTVSRMITNATTSCDDSFAANYGLTFAEGETRRAITFNCDGFGYEFYVNAADSVQDVADKLTANIQRQSNNYAFVDASGQIAVSTPEGEQFDLTVRDQSTNTELIYTPTERFGPMFSFNGRSGMVVPQAGDYTPEMIGISIASDEEVAEMLAGVFGAAE